ncbi:AAA family ATPase [uncultured Bacteroides sp.]|uniref:AAA family ATPase n=1 Tax=uncultured Bacteroides sp. TaxID=162156 RepID=UPI002AAB8492|nr:AAA family ATPase [uncultured Bacteroides sp.]
MADTNKKFDYILSKVKLLLKEEKNLEVYNLLEQSRVYPEWYNHDNWDGGIEFYNIHIDTDVATYARLRSEAKEIEEIKRVVVKLFDELNDDKSERYDNVELGFYDFENGTDIKILLPEDERNEIPFFVVKKKMHSYLERSNSHDTPAYFPSFVLVHNDGWNDYSAFTIFWLFYYPDKDQRISIGMVKIMEEESNNTFSVINKEFTMLPPSFCSLGVSSIYYANLWEALKNDKLQVMKVMAALRDAAYFSQIADHFERNDIFNKSLLRDNDSERALREGFYLAQGRDITDSYHFVYQYRPPYCKEDVQIDFPFKSDCRDFERLYGLIGENGTGKTSLLRSIPEMLMDNKNNSFIGDKPLFSQIMTVSYSPFDNFGLTDGDLTFKYLFCGLTNGIGDHISNRELVYRCKRDFSRLVSRGFEEFWKDAITDVIRKEIIELFIENNREGINIERLNDVFPQLSAGEANYLISMTALIANIRYDSLLLFDEPEQHLHPNAITSLMMRISELLTKFKSYAIVATHSPLVIRELVSSNVYVFHRDKDILNISKIGIECFGEDIAVLNDVIFGNEEQIKRFQKYLEQLIKKNPNWDYDNILKEIENGYLPLGMSAKMLIRRLIMERNGIN